MVRWCLSIADGRWLPVNPTRRLGGRALEDVDSALHGGTCTDRRAVFTRMGAPPAPPLPLPVGPQPSPSSAASGRRGSRASPDRGSRVVEWSPVPGAPLSTTSGWQGRWLATGLQLCHRPPPRGTPAACGGSRASADAGWGGGGGLPSHARSVASSHAPAGGGRSEEASPRGGSRVLAHSPALPVGRRFASFTLCRRRRPRTCRVVFSPPPPRACEVRARVVGRGGRGVPDRGCS